MAREPDWIDAGAADELSRQALRCIRLKSAVIALSFKDGEFGAISNGCNHVGGPLGEGRLAGDYVVCPWHYWKFHRTSGKGEPGFEEDRVPSFPVKVENGRVLVDVANPTRRHKKQHEPASAGARPGARARSFAACGHFDHRHARKRAALFRLRSSAQSCTRCCEEAGGGNQADHAARPEIPRLRRLFLQEFPCVHLALLDHSDGFIRSARPGLRGTGALVRRDHRHHARSAGAPPRRSISRWWSGSIACRSTRRETRSC
jgi:nitrite reductase/ring-hydroxylating ferredoxin subunit